MIIHSGYLYIGFGEKYINEAKVSAQSLRNVHPEAHITLITNTNDIDTVFDKIIIKPSGEKQEWKNGLIEKISGIQSSPYQNTIFVDTDTYFFERIDHLFDLLRHFDFLICHDLWEASDIKMNGEVIHGYHAFNTGMIAFSRNHKMDALLERWLETFKSECIELRHDQPAFMSALLGSKARFLVLPSIYNFRYTQSLSIHVDETVKLLHGRGTIEQFEWLRNKLNSSTDQRVWDAKNQKCRSHSSKDTPKNLLKKLIKILNLQ